MVWHSFESPSSLMVMDSNYAHSQEVGDKWRVHRCGNLQQIVHRGSGSLAGICKTLLDEKGLQEQSKGKEQEQAHSCRQKGVTPFLRKNKIPNFEHKM
jgi:hypothetical protein